MKKRRLKTARYLLEYAGLRIGLVLFDRLPLPIAETVGCVLADCFYWLNASRRRTAAANVRRAGISSEPRQIARIVRASFRHFVLVAIESLKFPEFFSAETWRERAVLDIHPDALDAVARFDRGLILASAHLGNWEIGGRLVSFLRPLTVIARKMNNPYTNRIMERRNAGTRVTLTPKRDTDARRLIRTLREGGALAVVIDQHAGGQGIPVDFFGVPASTFPTPALLHLRLRVPLVFAYCLRTGPMQYRLVIGPPIVVPPSGDRRADIRDILLDINRTLERAIRANPAQYLWAHRRWKDRPSGSPTNSGPSCSVPDGE